MGPSHRPKHSDVIVVESADIWFVIPTNDRAERWLKEHASPRGAAFRGCPHGGGPLRRRGHRPPEGARARGLARRRCAMTALLSDPLLLLLLLR
jgi:hypothetical protein